MSTPIHTNRLVSSSSPYLLQHAHNPVDWYPWGEEAFERARRDDKPLLVSIGYSACHWCHVMERESFEDEGIAGLMNERFVCVKVDREERPDLDEVYMGAVQMLTGSGGWPLNVFLTPELKPFHGGTYFPPEDRWGHPGFARVLRAVADAYRDQRGQLEESAEGLCRALGDLAATPETASAPWDDGLLQQAGPALRADFDDVWGGFGGAPKFPPSTTLGLLLRLHARTGDEALLRMVTLTLDRMAEGGLHDQVGGGFHRYSVDREWLVPHFEKMLYDNALLAVAYLEAAQVTGKPLYRDTAGDTLRYLLREMADEAGGFHSTQDADSEGEEGRYYVWTSEEVARALGAADALLFCRYYGVTPGGNFEGRSILHVATPPEAFARQEGLSALELRERLASMRSRLLAVRAGRVAPAKDDKVLADWNGLAISALAKGYRILGEEAFGRAAERAADFILREMRPEGRLRHAYRARRSYLHAYLDDYAFLVQGLLDLHEATFNVRWIVSARGLADEMIARLWDSAEGGFYFGPADNADVLVRTKRAQDGATPSGGSVAALALLRLAALTDTQEYREKAERTLTLTAGAARRSPRAFAAMLCAADLALGPVREVVIAGQSGAADTRALADCLAGRYLPNTIIAVVDPTSPDAAAAMQAVPATAGKPLIDGHAAAYVCDERGCQAPATSVESLGAVLSSR